MFASDMEKKMGFYDLSKQDRAKLVKKIHEGILSDLQTNQTAQLLMYFSSGDTYIRKSAYIATGRIFTAKPALQTVIIQVLRQLLNSTGHHVRQTVINAAGEIGMTNFELVRLFFDKGLLDQHHTVRNAVIGSLKKMSQKNPVPVLQWARQYLHHHNKEIRRQVCHGIELRGREHPQDILPLLKELQYDQAVRVRDTLIHVLGQIAYKRGCLSVVVGELNNWENKQLVKEALDEIIDVHRRYKDFAILSQKQAIDYIEEHCKSY